MGNFDLFYCKDIDVWAKKMTNDYYAFQLSSQFHVSQRCLLDVVSLRSTAEIYGRRKFMNTAYIFVGISVLFLCLHDVFLKKLKRNRMYQKYFF